MANEYPVKLMESKFWNPQSWGAWTSRKDAADVLSMVTDVALAELDCQPADRVLVVACGYGREIALFDCDLTAVDVSPEMVEAARRVRPDADIRVAHGESLPFPNNSFDKVLCLSALMHFADDRAAVAEMRRVVRPEGRVVISVNSALALGGLLTRPWLWLKSRRNPGFRQRFRLPWRFGGRVVKTTTSIGRGPKWLWRLLDRVLPPWMSYEPVIVLRKD
ncbi:MAG: class I SAM-dependent methyltransferase [Limisphaerales bacterium]